MQKYMISKLAVIGSLGVTSLLLTMTSQVDASPAVEIKQASDSQVSNAMVPPIVGGGQDPINAFLNCLAGCDNTRDAAFADAAATKQAAVDSANAQFQADTEAEQDAYYDAVMDCHDFADDPISCILLLGGDHQLALAAIEAERDRQIRAASRAEFEARQNAIAAWTSCVQGCVDQLAIDLASS